MFKILFPTFLGAVHIFSSCGGQRRADTELGPNTAWTTEPSAETNLNSSIDAGAISVSKSIVDSDHYPESSTDENSEYVGTTVLETSFESGRDGDSYSLESWVADGFHPRWVQGFNQERAHFDSSHAHTGNNSLRIDYPANAYLPRESGAQAPLDFPPRQEVYVSYWLRFSENFEWGARNHGGKLPGLGSGNNCNGGSAVCDGTTGFSARLMWRTRGKVVLYLYHMDKPGHFAESVNLSNRSGWIHFKPGQWHHVIERVKINTGNNKDGEVQLWIDGEAALFRSNLRFVNDGSLVDNLYFSTFHGGSDPSWAPSVNCHIWFDDLRIYY